MRTSLPRPINRVGPATKRWMKWHDKSRQAVFTRCMRLTFGNCEIQGCRQRAQDWAHLFSRGHVIAEPWCSLPELTLALCRGHHNALDRRLDVDLLVSLRWTALGRLVTRFPFASPLAGFSDPIDAARRAIDELDSVYEFDIETLTFTKREAA